MRRALVALAALSGAYAAVIPVLALHLAGAPPARAQQRAVVEVGAPAPEMAFTTPDGAEHALSEFRGRPVMLWLFATWCPTCQAGTRVVAGNFERLQRAGLRIIQLRLHNNLGYEGLSVVDFAARYAGDIAPSADWLWGEASLQGSFTYDPRGYPDIYFLIAGDGTIRAIDTAPHVTMARIVAFAEGAE